MENKLWINGQWMDSISGQTMDVENPATGETVGQVMNAGSEDVDLAVKAAKKAFYDGRWSRTTSQERFEVLMKMADLMEERKDEIARIESEDTGKPYEYLSLGADIPFAVDNMRYFASVARDTSGSRSGEYAPGLTSIFRHEPCGVSAGIAPWNYPFMMAAWKIGPPLVAGCASIIKPASITPRSTLFFGEIAKEAGLPDGVLNILTGNVGRALVEHPDIRMVSLTGATDTGKMIMKGAADTLKRVHLELGGKAPQIVFSDADIDKVVEKCILGAFCNTGQDCTAVTRVLVEKNILNRVTEAIVEATKAVVIGDPFEKDTEVGPLVSAGQRESVMGFVERAKADGGEVLIGGKIPADFDKGYYYEPTVITNVAQKSEIVQREVFGPVITIQSFDGEKEGLKMANDVDFGLAASVFTKDISRALRMASRLEFGTVWVNDHLALASEGPHGGFKHSGFGKDMSVESVHDYQVTKHIMVSTD